MRRALLVRDPVAWNGQKMVSSAVQMITSQAGRGGERPWSADNNTRLESKKE